MPSSATILAAPARLRLLSRTALCGALYGLALLPAAHAGEPLPPPVQNPVGGFAEVNAGGGLPVIVQDERSTTVDLNAPRTIISWSSYDVGPENRVTYEFESRDWIVLNRVSGLQLSKIEGTIEGKVGNAFGGNIWFVSNNGIVFGKTAKFDAGGLLVAIGTPNTSGFLDPGNFNFSFSGADAFPGARVWALSGAEITAHGGPVAFLGPSVVTRNGALITATGQGSVLYGAAETYQVRFAPGSGGDFDMVDFIVPSASGGTDEGVALDLAGVTRGNSVFMAAVPKGAVTGAVINAEGLITAQAANADGGDIILSGGGGISGRQAAAPVQGAGSTDIFLNQAVASRDLVVRNVGRIFGNPWPRPPEQSKDPPSIAEQQQIDEDCLQDPHCTSDYYYYCEYFSCNGRAPVIAREEDIEQLSDLFDPAIIQNVNAGRDVRIQASQRIELGRVIAGRDLSVEAPTLRGNSLISAGALTVRATAGDIALAGVGVQGQSTIEATNDVRVDAISASQRLTITAGNNIQIGDGTSSVAGLISLDAAKDVTVELANARIDTVRAGGTANLRGGALEITSVTAPRLFAQGTSVNIGSATSTGDIYVIATSGDAILGTANSGDDVYVLANNGAASLGQATVGTGADGVSFGFSGNPDEAGNGRVVLVESTNGDARLGLGTGSIAGATAVTVRAGQDALVNVTSALPGAFQVVGARDVTLTAPSFSLESITAGRDLTLNTTAGGFTATQALVATRNISISASGALQVADVRADSGSVSLTGATVTAGAVRASEDLTLKALSGGVTTASFQAGRDLIVQGASLSLGGTISSVARDLSITTPGNFTASSNLTAGRNLSLNVGGTGVFQNLTASTGSVQISGGTITTGAISTPSLLAVDVTGKATIGQTNAGSVRILAGDLDMTGLLSAPTVQIESRNGPLRVGGAAGDTPGGMTVDDAEFGRLRVSGEVKLYAGNTTGSARGDLVVQTLTVNPANTPRVTLLAGSQRNALVQGVAAPTANGGIFRIGDATNLSWRPGSILISGAVGAATFSGGGYSDVRAFDEVRLAATQDILMGSDRFITLIQQTPVGDIDISSARPVGVTPTAGEQFKVFVAAGRLEVSAENKVVQQNTSPVFGQSVGLFLTGAASPSLIIDPPKLVDLYGALAGPDGKVTSGQTAGQGITFTVVDQQGQPTQAPPDSTYRFNSCKVGTGVCAAPAADPMGPTQGAGALTVRDALSGNDRLGGSSSTASATGDDAEAQQEAEVSNESIARPPVLLGVAPADNNEIVTDPVTTGTGSEEIWRERRRKSNDQ